MFTGIVEAVGWLVRRADAGGGATLAISAPFDDLELGESVCVSGVCLTVTSAAAGAFSADVSAETLRRSKLGALSVGGRVNLERSLRLGDRLGGHLVAGHVDAVGTLVSIEPEGESALYRFRAPADVTRALVEKGSVAVDGVSLTVFQCDDDGFSVAVIPHTARTTTLGGLVPGAPVNLEGDLVGKYVERLLAPYREARRR